MPAKITSPAMTAPTTMPTFAPESRLEWLVTEDIDGKDVEVDVKEADFEASEVDEKEAGFEASEVEVDKIEMLGIDDTKGPGIFFNWSSGIAWKVSSRGSGSLCL